MVVVANAKSKDVKNGTKNEAFVPNTEAPIVAVSSVVSISPGRLDVPLNIDMLSGYSSQFL